MSLVLIANLLEILFYKALKQNAFREFPYLFWGGNDLAKNNYMRAVSYCPPSFIV